MAAAALAQRPWWRPTPEGTDFEKVQLWWGCGQASFDWEAFHARPPGSPPMLINRAKGNAGAQLALPSLSTLRARSPHQCRACTVRAAGIVFKDRLCLNLRIHDGGAPTLGNSPVPCLLGALACSER